jgi:hypothetical protein
MRVRGSEWQGKSIASGPVSQLPEYVMPAIAGIQNLNLPPRKFYDVVKNEPIFEQIDFDRSVANPKRQIVAIFIRRWLHS